MKTYNKALKKGEKVIFANESASGRSAGKTRTGKFKLLIVDDEKEIHVMTKLVLSDYSYKGFTLEFYSAYSGKEAKKLIKDHPDAACILLDVVMEANDSGLEVARFIREDEKNKHLRIILRTGQPGKAPEKDIILNYDINDYKEKTELTTQKLFTTITTALRSYIHLIDLDAKTKEIAEKNIRLNEEIARRIVAESNLTKYNRSLEKMIDSKSTRLKAAIFALKKKEKELQKVNKLANVGEISSSTLSRFDFPGETLKKNLDTMNKYQTDMTLLLEKYETLQNIISLHSGLPDNLKPEKTNDILNDIDKFKQDIDLDEILTKYPEIIKDSTRGIEYISNAVNDIRLFISISDEPLKKTDINSMLKKVSNKIKSRFSSKIDLQIDFGNLPKISVAKKNMAKAFHEIIKNAFEAVKSHGIVSISTSYEEPDITVIISDIGYGIAPENLPYIFKPYFTINKKNAKGLGLTFAKSVITNAKSTIDIISILNEGTNITVKLCAGEIKI
ncbi:MAG: response regulator [Deltaproteobacteria bacterium]|nr:response regulator [Deltaproteobacteria bacterium]